jgi:hypothetical protein
MYVVLWNTRTIDGKSIRTAHAYNVKESGNNMC